mmetsp:Transcript_1058/g.1960  ORF Transcript_1058/g.1960 Transcript_1058/m.1960 type:complete len:190 (+) Transcript_1058:851-1420(+)
MGVRFSKRGLVETIERICAQESRANKEDMRTAKRWEEKIKTPGIVMYLKKGGSDQSEDQPFMRTESNFNKAFKMNKLLKVIYEPEHQKGWDKNLEVAEKQPFDGGSKTIAFSYVKNKKQFTISSRDFYEKGFNFVHNGKFYRYSTSIDHSEDALKPLPDGQTVRGFTFYNAAIMEREPKTGKILFQVVT